MGIQTNSFILLQVQLWTVGDNQLASVRKVLEGDGKEIARLIRVANEAKRDLAV